METGPGLHARGLATYPHLLQQISKSSRTVVLWLSSMNGDFLMVREMGERAVKKGSLYRRYWTMNGQFILSGSAFNTCKTLDVTMRCGD